MMLPSALVSGQRRSAPGEASLPEYAFNDDFLDDQKNINSSSKLINTFMEGTSEITNITSTD